MVRIKKGDTVIVVAGADAGKTGRVLRVMPDDNRVVVQGVRLVYKHVRRSQQNPQGGRVQREAPIHASNVMYYNESTQKGERIRVVRRDGKRIRVLASSNTELAN